VDVRKAMFAGSWYPESAAACEREIKKFLEGTDLQPVPRKRFVGGIVPHAGWFYSGSIACNVIHAMKGGGNTDVLFVFGMHLHPRSSARIMTGGAWETPFGKIEIESRCAGALTERFGFAIETARDFTPDNTIELQLPFIKYFFPEAKIVPMGVPPAAASLEIGTTAVQLSIEMGLAAKVIGSTDLTHYGTNYGFMPKGTGPAAVEWVKTENDRRIVDAMLAMDPARVLREALDHQNACCAGAAATAISASRALGAEGSELFAYTTSYDRSPGDSLVGYAGLLMSGA
jgi:MEMO1 family protein